MKYWFLALIVLLVAGCTRAPVAPAPTAVSQPTTVLVVDLPSVSRGSQTIAGTLLTTPEGAVLAGTVVRSNEGSAPLDPLQSIWLGEVTLPPDLSDNPLAAQIVEVAGAIEGPGSFGPEGMYRYRIGNPTVDTLSPRVITIELLLQNSGLYREQAVRLNGELLLSSSSAILSERSGPGGVPADESLQIKLAPLGDNQILADQLRPGSGAGVYYGSVQITGLWRNNQLYPLIIAIP